MSFSNPKPLVTVQVGQAGVQIGHAVWELFCLEHNISIDGNPKLHCGDLGNVETVFVPTPKGRYFPRSLFVDTDPCCIDEIRSGPYQQLFSSRQLISDETDAASNYTTGRYGYSKRLLPDTLERLRWMMEKADAKPTVCLLHSACGGTGSGFTVACLSRMAEELGIGAQHIVDLCVVPGKSAALSSCELLNTALYLDESQELTRQTVCVSNSALFRLCNAQLQSNGSATFAHVNRALAAAFSNLTATERLPGSSISLGSILDSLLPFRHLRYPLLACAPFLTAEAARTERPTAKTASAAVLEPASQFLDVDVRKGRHAAAFLLYRGAASLTETQKLAADLAERKLARFHDWAPSGFRTGLVAAPPVAPPSSGFADSPVSVTLLASHSGVSGAFAKMAADAKKLQDRDMFVHGYEGAIVALLNRQADRATAKQAKPPSISSASADNNSVREWMNPPHGHGALQDYLRRRLPSKDPELQQPQQQQEERQVSRTCALSDVFGVRVRLSSAIDFLQRVSTSYAEDRRVDAVGTVHEVEAAEPAVQQDDDDDSDEDTNDNDEKEELSQQVQDVADTAETDDNKEDEEEKVHVTIQDVADQSKAVESSDSNRSTTGDQSNPGSPGDAADGVQQAPQQQRPASREDEEAPPANNANQCGGSERPQPRDSSGRWCLRRRSKSRQRDEAPAAAKHPAIAEAERILMKYQRSLGGQQ